MLVALAYPVLYGFTPGGLDGFTRVVGQIFGPVTLAGFALKCVLFGAAVAVIPISAGLEADRRRRTPPIAVRGGMVRLFFVLGLIEVASLAARYIG
jgi:phospholipid/cholesterol/gamma-HCH transport system permease protein